MPEKNKPSLTLPKPTVLVFAVLLIGVGFWVYLEPLRRLVGVWQRTDYVHGFLVPIFSLVLLWDRRDLIEGKTFKGSYWGLAFLALFGLMQWTSAYFVSDAIEAFSLIPFLAGITLFLGGWLAMKWAWPAIVFLVFMVPLPQVAGSMLSHQLQRIGTIVSVFTLQTLGIPAAAQGNVILLPKAPLEVAEACSGIKMLMLFFAASVGAALIMRHRPIWERLLIFISAIPIAVISNVVRIAITGLLYETVSPELGHKVFHDLAGWFMMPLAIGLVWLELGLLSAIFIEPVGIGSYVNSPSQPAPVPSSPKQTGK